MEARKTAVFDLDGTLLDTIGDIADAMNSVLARYSLPVHDRERYKIFVGNGARILTERALGDRADDPKLIDKILKEYNDAYHADITRTTAPYDGIEEMLRDLTVKGVDIAVFTNKPHRDMLKLVGTLLPDYPFFTLIGQREGYRLKPYPDVLDEMLAGRDKSECFFIGDTAVDVATAKNAGVRSIGCVWGFRGESELISAGADAIAHTPADVTRYILDN